MRLSEKQAMALLDIAKGTLWICRIIGGFDESARLRIVDEIVDQQSDQIRDLESKELSDGR